jgi:predicted kinase/NTP pyrophosphatase (non-canonical NTP hydrolase)
MIKLLVGPIGSGKSTFAKSQEGCLSVDDDSIIHMLHRGYEKHDDDMFLIYDAVVLNAARVCLTHGKSVIVDSGRLTSVKRREPWMQLARALSVPVVAVVFHAFMAETHAQRRFDHDPRGLSYEDWLSIARHQIAMYEVPTVAEGFIKVYEFDNEVHSMNMIQQEHKEWLDRMFPHQDPVMPACGMVEESAELLHALLKYAQSLTWGHEARYKDVVWRDKMVDAIGDCALYACSYCNTVGWDFALLCRAVPAFGGGVPLTRASRLVASANTFVQDRTWTNAYIYMSELRGISAELHIDFDDAVHTTWQEVKLRCR